MQTNRNPLVAGNWKLNGDLSLVGEMVNTLDSADLGNVSVLVCPPLPYLHGFESENLHLGAQNLSEFESGAHTGEVAGRMLKEVGCSHVIVGHSERRADNQEDNQLVASKVAAALKSDLIPVLCVGEPEDIREDGAYLDFIAAQVDAVINEIGIKAFSNLVLAYEPVWAIGTGKTASPEQAQEVHAFIRSHLAKFDTAIAERTLILYGGSVKPGNAAELFSQSDVDGGLIGGASLDPKDFLSICLAAKQ